MREIKATLLFIGIILGIVSISQYFQRFNFAFGILLLGMYIGFVVWMIRHKKGVRI